MQYNIIYILILFIRIIEDVLSGLSKKSVEKYFLIVFPTENYEWNDHPAIVY